MAKTRKYKNSILGLLIGLGLGVGYNEYNLPHWQSFDIDTKNTNVCFTPPSGCANLIAEQINHAKDSIYLHAYGLTSDIIIDELAGAQKRGVKVRAVLDSSNFSERRNIAARLKKAGIEVTLDKVPGIAHNKIMIIDAKQVITGSFNFTKSADTRNAENVLMIEDKDLASSYLTNWQKRNEHGKKY